MVKGFNEAWRNSGRKESEISIRYQYKGGTATRGKRAALQAPLSSAVPARRMTDEGEAPFHTRPVPTVEGGYHPPASSAYTKPRAAEGVGPYAETSVPAKGRITMRPPKPSPRTGNCGLAPPAADKARLEFPQRSKTARISVSPRQFSGTARRTGGSRRSPARRLTDEVPAC